MTKCLRVSLERLRQYFREEEEKEEECFQGKVLQIWSLDGPMIGPRYP